MLSRRWRAVITQREEYGYILLLCKGAPGQGLISSFDLSALRPKPNPFLQRKWEGTTWVSYLTHTVPSPQSSDKDKSPPVKCEFQAVLRTLQLTSTVPPQAAPCTTPDTQGRMGTWALLCLPWHPNEVGKLELLHCPLTSSAGAPFSSSRYFFNTDSGSVGVAAQGEMRQRSQTLCGVMGTCGAS